MPDRLRTRPEFLAAAKGRRHGTSLFTLQALQQGNERTPRIGITVTKKAGGATERNRIRRRLREAVRLGRDPDRAELGRPGHDYVIVARREILTTPFSALRDQLIRTFDRASTTGSTPAGAGVRRSPPPHSAERR